MGCVRAVRLYRTVESEEKKISIFDLITTSTAMDHPTSDINMSSPCPVGRAPTPTNNGGLTTSVIQLPKENKALTPNVTPCNSKKAKNNFISPEIIQPYPKAPARKENSNRGRQRGRCMIATDTPEKVVLEEKMRQKEDNIAKKKKVTRKALQDESSDDESIVIEYSDHSSDDSFDLEEDRDNKNVSKGDYIIANVYGKACVRKYFAVVDDINDEGYEVKFLKRNNSPSNRFSFTSESAATVSLKDVVTVLPKPFDDNRPRFEGMVYFNTNLTEFSLV